MELKNVVPWGRSFEEYREIFSLTDVDLSKYILGCGDGPASFNADLSSMGGKVVSVDPTYCFSIDQFRGRITEVYDEVMPQMHINKDKYLWKSIPSVEALGKVRLSAMEKFMIDYEIGKSENRYIEGTLPKLDFHDQQFELALCSHYLFLYSEQVSLQTHIESLAELCRVAQEVRVYPLIALSGDISPHLSDVTSKLNEMGKITSLVDVSYQFQKGANQMLVVKSV